MTSEPTTTLYRQIAHDLSRLIHSGTLKAGQRLPSVRETAVLHGVSISTAMQAYHHLEEHGLAQARPKAGYYVRRPPRIVQPGLTAPPQRSFSLKGQSRSDAFARLHQPGDQGSFGGFMPESSELFDEDRLRVALGRASRVHRHTLATYNKADAGTPRLRQAIARRALHLGCALGASDIVITASCTQAVSLCLAAVTRPGDIVALESPTFFGYFDLLESLNLRALEIPTHPRTGLSLPALELALDTSAGRVCNGQYCYRAAGRVRSQGFEAELHGTLASGLQIAAGYTFNRSRLTSVWSTTCHPRCPPTRATQRSSSPTARRISPAGCWIRKMANPMNSA